mgnify:CR=1 FL=1
MGLDVSSFKFLLHKSKEAEFKDTLTLGRQSCHTSLKKLKVSGWDKEYIPEYIEEICANLFGSYPNVQSIDNSSYENATIIHNMNNPINSDANKEEFDTVLDLGTLEHVFNVKQSILNAIYLLKIGGRILHVLPCNNFGGHGFYQFSPEFFFSLYNKENGFGETEVFVKSLASSSSYYKVKKPMNGKRALITSIYPVYVFVSTKKLKDIKELKVQQSDYINLWESFDDNAIKDNSNNFGGVPYWDKWPIKYIYRPYSIMKSSVSFLNPYLKKFKF